MAKRAKLFSSNTTIEELGSLLKQYRVELGYSLGDVVEMTGFPKSTILNLEKGISSNISYYIAFGQSVRFSVLTSKINIRLNPRFELSPDRKNRRFLTLKIRNLYKADFFKEKKSVNDVIEKLNEPTKNNKMLSTKVSGILLNFVEDETLQIIEKAGRNNIYLNR